MQDATEWKLQVEIEGLSLWINRGKYIDVLFPHDRLIAKPHHYVTLSRGADSGPTLDGVTLDFTTLVGDGKLVKRDPIGWIGTEIEAGSIAADPDAIFKMRGIVAALRLPLGTLMKMPNHPLIGDFDFGTQTGVKLGYGVTWVMKVSGKKAIDVRWHEPAMNVAEIRTLGAFDPSATEQRFRIRSLSDHDRAPQPDVEPGEELTEATFVGYLSRADGLALRDTPIYRGPAATGAAKITSLPAASDAMVAPKKPCPSIFGAPF